MTGSGMTLPGMDVAALAGFLEREGVELSGDLRVELISGGKSNLTYKAYDDASQWVVRRPPTSGLTPSAHDMNREWTVTNALQGSAVPVANTVAFDRDGSALGAPCTVVAFVEGRVLRSSADLRDLSDADVSANAAELVRVLAELHSIDYRAVGLENFGRPAGFTTRQVELWAGQWERVKTRELADLAVLRDALLESVPAESSASIVHGDYRVDNVILGCDPQGAVAATSIAAVVDWELSTLGDPLTDAALMCVYRQPIFDEVLGIDAAWTSNRYPSPDSLAQMYAVATARDLRHWNFYMALANFKIAVIAEGITHRALVGSDAGGGALGAAEATHEFLAAGIKSLGGLHVTG